MLKGTENVNFLVTPGWRSLLCLPFCKNEAGKTLNSPNQITVYKTPNSHFFLALKRGWGIRRGRRGDVFRVGFCTMLQASG